MPVSFRLFRLRKFPDQPAKPGTAVFTRDERRLIDDVPPRTFVTSSDPEEELGIEVYLSRHEMLRRLAIRTPTGEDFDSFYRRDRFPLIVSRDHWLLACQCSSVVAKNLVDTLNEAYPISFRADYLAIDFDRLRPKIKEFYGIWLSQIGQPNISSLAMFGDGVDKSALYKQLESLGHASSVQIRYMVNGRTFHVILSRRGTITFPQPASDREHLSRALSIYHDLLDGTLVEEDSSRTAKEKREAAKRDARRSGHR